MNEENKEMKETESKKIRMKWMVITIIISIITILLTANIFASHLNGTNNIFFKIKEWIAPSNETTNANETSVNETLTNPETIISYEPITITEGIKLEINKLAIEENKSTLYLSVNESETKLKVTPFSYKVYTTINNQKTLICSQVSSKEENDVKYTERLEMTNVTKDTKSLILEIVTKDNELLVILHIDLENKEIAIQNENMINVIEPTENPVSNVSKNTEEKTTVSEANTLKIWIGNKSNRELGLENTKIVINPDPSNINDSKSATIYTDSKGWAKIPLTSSVQNSTISYTLQIMKLNEMEASKVAIDIKYRDYKAVSAWIGYESDNGGIKYVGVEEANNVEMYFYFYDDEETIKWNYYYTPGMKIYYPDGWITEKINNNSIHGTPASSMTGTVEGENIKIIAYEPQPISTTLEDFIENEAISYGVSSYVKNLDGTKTVQTHGYDFTISEGLIWTGISDEKGTNIYYSEVTGTPWVHKIEIITSTNRSTKMNLMIDSILAKIRITSY